AEIEQRASAAGLALVLFDDLRLAPDSGGDGAAARIGIAGQHLAALGLEPAEQLRVLDQSIFDDLGIAGADLSRIERIEACRIDQHLARLVESADEVLAGGNVDAGL